MQFVKDLEKKNNKFVLKNICIRFELKQSTLTGILKEKPRAKLKQLFCCEKNKKKQKKSKNHKFL